MKKFVGFILGIAVWCFGFFILVPVSPVGYVFEFLGGMLIGYFLVEIFKNKPTQ